MISYIRGNLAAMERDKVIVDVHGVVMGFSCRSVPWDFCPRWEARSSSIPI